MRRLYSMVLVVFLTWLLGNAARADEFKLANGNVMRGELASADEDGLVVKLDVGGFSKREPWINFSQETLKQLANDSKVAPFVEPFIELDPEQLKAREKAKEIIVKPVESRLERPSKPALLGAFTTPIGLTILAVLMLANLFAAHEIALFRQQPVALVCALSVLLPVLAPILFLSLPTRATPARPETQTETQPEAPPAAGGAQEQSNLTSRVKSKVTSMFKGQPAGGGLTLAAAKKEEASSAESPAQMFTRGEFTFNRRFFETKFPGFFRVVPSEAEKDLVIVIKAVRGEYTGRRISRISSNEMHLQLQSGGASAEVMVPFVEIQSVQIRHKDAKG